MTFFLILLVCAWNSITYYIYWTYHYFTQDTTKYTPRVPLKYLEYSRNTRSAIEEYRQRVSNNPELLQKLDKDTYAKMTRFLTDGIDCRIEEEESIGGWKKLFRGLLQLLFLSSAVLAIVYSAQQWIKPVK